MSVAVQAVQFQELCAYFHDFFVNQKAFQIMISWPELFKLQFKIFRSRGFWRWHIWTLSYPIA